MGDNDDDDDEDEDEDEDKFLRIERKITSVVHSYPPSHYIRTHAFLPAT